MSGIAREMPPITRMVGPPEIDDLRTSGWEPGKITLRSKLVAFGVFPLGSFDLAISELEEDMTAGRAKLVEQSQMTGMRSWKHQREVLGDDRQCTVTDTLTFEPGILPGVARRLIGWFFGMRHKRLRKMYGVAP